MTPDDLLDGVRRRRRRAARRAGRRSPGIERRARTDRTGQYHLDTVADAAVLPVLHAVPAPGAERGVGVERAGRRRDHRRRRSGRRLDQLRARHPVLGHLAVRARRRRPAVRAGRERRHRRPLHRGARTGRVARRRAPARVGTTTEIDRAVVALVGHAAARSCRGASSARSGSAALALCDVAAGELDGFLDCHRRRALRRGTTSVALLVCRESRRARRRRATTATSSSPIPSRAVSWWPRARPSCSRRCAPGRRREPSTSTSTRCSAPRSTPRSPQALRSCATASARRSNVREKGPGDW